MKICRADCLGFCNGVRSAVAKVESALAQGECVYATGPIAHNRNLISSLEARGLITVQNYDQVPNGALFVVRAHGVSKQDWDMLHQLEKRDVRILDTTCPCVQMIFDQAQHYAVLSHAVIILGEHGHPEVEATRSWAGDNSYVIANSDEISGLNLISTTSIVILAQSTLDQSLFLALSSQLGRNFPAHVVINTICSATKLRQDAAVVLAHKVDKMLIIGGKHSANTLHLYELCAKVNAQSYLIESACDLAEDWAEGAAVIGITAGASTPEWIIEEVETKLMDWEKNLETPEEMPEVEKAEDHVESQVAEQAEVAEQQCEGQCAGEPCACEASEDKVDAVQESNEEVPTETSSATQDSQVSADSASDDSDASDSTMDGDLEEAMEMGAFDLPRHSVGDVIKATVVNIRSDEVLVDVGLKSEGVIPRRELSYDTSLQPDEIVRVGEEIEVEVLRSEDQEGRITFSKRHADAKRHWGVIIEHFENGDIIEGKVTEAIKGGLLVDIGVRGFMPASQAERRFTSDLRHLVGETIRVKLLEVDRAKERAIVSRKAVLDLEADTAKEAFWGKVSEGDIVTGVVRRLTDFGAFVDLGGVDGLLHISDMAYHRVNKPSDIVAIDQELQLKILKLNPDTSKVSLGLKQLQPRPWEALSNELQQNDIIEGTVVRTTAWGAFVNVRPGIDGLIHISELDNQRVAKVEDVVQIGDHVQVMVLGINASDERLSLSLKAVKNLAAQEEGYYEEDGYYEDQEYSDQEYSDDQVYAEEQVEGEYWEENPSEEIPEEVTEVEAGDVPEVSDEETEEPVC